MDRADKTEVLTALSRCMAENILHLNIKDINPALITDINEMILMRFKELSLDEVYYAFKLYRYGVIGEDLQSYGQFNSMFVQKLLTAYKNYKVQEIRKNNIKNEKEEQTLSEEEKELRVLLGLKRAYDEYCKGEDFGVGYYLYDYLNKKGFVNISNEDKYKALDLARLKLVSRTNAKRERGLKFDLKKELQRINSKLDDDVIQVAKTESLKLIFEQWKSKGLTTDEIPKNV